MDEGERFCLVLALVLAQVDLQVAAFLVRLVRPTAIRNLVREQPGWCGRRVGEDSVCALAPGHPGQHRDVLGRLLDQCGGRFPVRGMLPLSVESGNIA